MPDRSGPSPPSEILHARSGRVGTVTINRPPLNILSVSSFEAMGRALNDLTGEDPVDIIVIQAAGERAFCAGADVADHTPERAPAMLESFHAVARLLLSTEAVSVAAVRGLALGGGMELALCCDLVLASQEAELGQPEIRIGAFPPIAATLLPALVGRQRASEIILTGRRVRADEALRLGLVSRVVPAASFDAALHDLIGSLSEVSGAVMRCAVRALRRQVAFAFSAALGEAERVYREDLLPLPDAREGVEAYLMKRQPRWTSR